MEGDSIRAMSPELEQAEIDKVIAETKRLGLDLQKAEIEIEKKRMGISKMREEVAQASVATRKLAAEADKAASDAALAQATAEAAALDLRVKTRSVLETMANDRYNHTYYFTDPITPQSVEHCRERLTVWDRVDPECEIEIVFCSGGGDFIQGMHLFDFIRHLSSRHKIVTGVLGQALSMAGILLQAGDERWVGKESYVMIHEISVAVGGKASEINDEAKLLERMGERVLNVFVDKAKAAAARPDSSATEPISKATIKKNWNRKDWYLTSDECLKFGVADYIR